MLPAFLDRLTPRTSPRTRLLTAAVVWTTVGAFLCAKGLLISRQEAMGPLLLTIATSLGLGLIKSKFVFDKVGVKIVSRIENKPRSACLGGLFSFRNWILIIVMSLFGRAIGSLPLNASLKTGIYVMVGSGLAFSSRLMWAAWKSPIVSELRRI